MGGGGRGAVRLVRRGGDQPNATIDTASGYQVMGFPGTAPHGYADYSYGRKLSRELTTNGSLP